MCKKTNMSKRLLLTIATVLAIAMQSSAQMVLKMPKWEKFVRINADGVNLRKAPGANSPKLYSRGFDWSLEFSWTPRSEFEPYHLEAGAILPVLKESAEWYCLYLTHAWYGNFYDAYEVYVMKRYCTEVTPASFGAQDVIKTEGEMVKGPTGYVVGVYCLGSPSRAPWCRIGHKAGKYIVMADYVGAMEFAQKFVRQGESVMDQEFQIGKVRESDINSFVRSQQAPTIFDVWVKFAEEDWPRMYVFDASKYKHPIAVYTVTPATTSAQNTENETVYDQADQMPSFPGGASGLNSWLSENIHYPAAAKANKVQGRVIVTFVVERDGSISNAKVARSVDPALDREAIRVVSAMPTWNPGRKNGEPVRVKYTVPITFRL